MIRIAEPKSLLRRAVYGAALLALCVAPSMLAQTTAGTFKDIADKPPAGWTLAGSKPENYKAGIDGQAVFEEKPSAYLEAKVQNTGGFGSLMQSFSAEQFLGKRVRLRAWVRALNATGWAGIWMRVDKASGPVAFDNMESRPIKGTTGWTSYDVVLDVPQDATTISLGILLNGPGRVWMSGVKFEAVDKDVPVTGAPPPAGPVNLEFGK
ncbi:MAG: hypothetical protein P4L10_13500 [Acidobacteriaceae bacterium]|jgi:hypothetical protein|nr:hypothetical protein [Acidobacteriaceae bacterium]